MNKAIGVLVIVMYLSNYYICDYFFLNDLYNWYQLNISIISACMLIAIKYKSDNNFFEKLFNSMVANNIYVILFKHETDYTLNDLWFVAIFTIAQYIKKDKKDE